MADQTESNTGICITLRGQKLDGLFSEKKLNLFFHLNQAIFSLQQPCYNDVSKSSTS